MNALMLQLDLFGYAADVERSLRSGGAAIESLCALFSHISHDCTRRRAGTRDYRTMVDILDHRLQAHAGDAAWRQGFLRALAALLCSIGEGRVPELLAHEDPLEPWDPIGETAAAYGEIGAVGAPAAVGEVPVYLARPRAPAGRAPVPPPKAPTPQPREWEGSQGGRVRHVPAAPPRLRELTT